MVDFIHILQGYFAGTGAIILIAPVPVKQPWQIWVNKSNEYTKNDNLTTTEPGAYFMGYTVI